MGININMDKKTQRNEFHGNFDRDQVEVSLDKFIDVLNELNQLKLQIREKELVEQSNKFKKGIALANMIDKWRLFPRIFISVYLYLLYESSMWFMSLENPTTDQFGLVSVIIGAGAAWFGLYVRSKGDGEKTG